ncbi:MAG: hypothetical protein QXQ94_08240 [Candidatus Bathyarchaeia archaeon]
MEKGVRRVLWIPKKLDEEIENLRHQIGYTRSGFYRYALTRLMEQLLLTKQKEIHLQAWQEIAGLLKKVEVDDEITTAIITCTNQTDFIISYPNNTKEAETLQTLKKLTGEKIEILRTDDPEKPLLIRTFNETPEPYKNFCASLVVRSRFLWVAFKLVAFNFTLWHLGSH